MEVKPPFQPSQPNGEAKEETSVDAAQHRHEQEVASVDANQERIMFRREVIKIFLDKGLLAAMLIVFGLLANLQLERFKSNLTDEIEEVKSIVKEKYDVRAEQRQHLAAQLAVYWPLDFYLDKDTHLYNDVFKCLYEKRAKKKLFGSKLESDAILPNHDAAVRLIQEKWYLLEPDDKLGELLHQYVRHVAIYHGLRAIGDQRTPREAAAAENWDKSGFPEDLPQLVHEKAIKLQQKYNKLVRGIEGGPIKGNAGHP